MVVKVILCLPVYCFHGNRHNAVLIKTLKSIFITNVGGDIRIILSNYKDIETIMNKLYEFDFTSTDKTGMTLGGYVLKIMNDDTIDEFSSLLS